MAENYEKTYKTGDTGEPVRTCVMQDSNGAAPDWSSAIVRFLMYSIDYATGELTEVLDELAGVEAPAASSGTLRYDWKAGELVTKGRFPAIFKVTDGDLVERYPRKGYMWLNVEDGFA